MSGAPNCGVEAGARDAGIIDFELRLNAFYMCLNEVHFIVLGQGGNLCRGCLLLPQTVCRGKSMIYMSFLLDESSVCGIDFSNTLQGHTGF